MAGMESASPPAPLPVVLPPPAPLPPPPGRLASLDALRGFDMLWIVGLDAVVDGLRKVSDGRAIRGLAAQLEHVGWAGFHFEDLIFPLFVFIAGVSLVFSLDRAVEAGGAAAARRRLLRRGLLLYLAGVLYYGGLSSPIAEIRWLGVLQRIAICSMAAGWIALNRSSRGVAAWIAGLLVGYWAVLAAAPLAGAGSYAEGDNVANWVDARFLPGKKWDGDHDPEGLLSTLPAVATCLLGVLAGRLLRAPAPPAGRKALLLAAAGAAGIAAGWAWHPLFPVIKKIWTSSYVLVAGGWSALLLAGFHYLIDVRGWRRWARPFGWIGTNALAVYFLHNLADVGGLASRLVGGDVQRLAGRFGGLLWASASLGITFAFARFLDRRGIRLRL